METSYYWDNPEYKEAIKGYSEYSIMCNSLNMYSPRDRWAFDKRDEYNRKVNELRHK